MKQLLQHQRTMLILLCAAVFFPVLGFGFVALDDGLLVVNNPVVIEFNLLRAFSSYDPELYVPLTLFLYQIQYMLVGATPFLFHLTNLALHILNVCLVYSCVRRLGIGSWVAWCTAAVFAVHPLQVESVAWISATKDLLSATFFLLAFHFYLQANGRAGEPAWWKSVGSYALGLLAKVSVILLPIALLSVDWMQKRLSWPRILSKWPYFLLATIFAVVAIGGKQDNLQTISVMQHGILAVRSFGTTLQHIVYPVGLTVLYEQHGPLLLDSPDFIVSLVWSAVFALLVLFAWWKSRAVLIGLLFFILFFAPSLATFVKNGQLFYASDRYSYLAIVGIAFAMFSALQFLQERGGLAQKVIEILSPALIAVLAILSAFQVQTWSSTAALFSRVLVLDDQSLVAHNNMGSVYQEEGDTEKAEQHFRRALAIDPYAPAPLANLGVMQKTAGNEEAALQLFERAIPGIEQYSRVNRSDLVPYFLSAEILENQGDTDRAVKLLTRAAEMAPHVLEAHLVRGVLLQRYNRYPEAENAFGNAVELAPAHVDALYRLAAVQSAQGKTNQAVATLEQLVAINPQYQQASQHLQNLRSISE